MRLNPRQGDEIDGLSDVYGLGATLYEVLTGRQVFEAQGLAATLRMILNERPVPSIVQCSRSTT